MADKEKLTLLAQILEIDETKFNEETELRGLDGWDSMAMISLIALLDERFGRTIPAAEIVKLKYVKDIINLMN